MFQSFSKNTTIKGLYPCCNQLAAWSSRSGLANSTRFEFADFAWGITHGITRTDGQDLESEQSHTFTVRASENADSVLASSPVLHSNGTLEFELKVNRTGYANFSIVLTDDGFDQDVAAGTLNYTSSHGVQYHGRNVSEETHFSIFVAATYALIHFNTSSFNGLDSAIVLETARRVIAAGEGLQLGRLIPWFDTSHSPGASIQILCVDTAEALMYTARGPTYAQWLQTEFADRTLSFWHAQAYVRYWKFPPARFTLTEHLITVLGFQYPVERPFEFPNFVRDVIAPADSPLDIEGRQQVFLDIKMLRWRRKEADVWVEAQNDHQEAVLSSAHIRLVCRPHCLDSFACCNNATFIASKRLDSHGEVEYEVGMRDSNHKDVFRVQALFSMNKTVVQVRDGEEEQFVHNFIESSVDFKVSDQIITETSPSSISPDELLRSSTTLSLWHNWQPLIHDKPATEDPYSETHASNGFIVSTLKQSVLLEHAADAYILVQQIPQDYQSPVLGMPRIELRVEDGTLYGELRFHRRPFAIGNVSFSFTLFMKSHNLTGGVFQIVVKPVNQPPRFTFPSHEVTVLEDEYSTHNYMNTSFAVDIGPGPIHAEDEEGQHISFSVHTQSIDWLKIFSAGPLLYTNGTLVFRTHLNMYGSADFNAVLVDDGGSEHAGSNSSAAFFRIMVLSVNTAPSFDLIPSVVLLEDAGSIVKDLFASNISSGEFSGPELMQGLTFHIVEVSPTAETATLFAERPFLAIPKRVSARVETRSCLMQSSTSYCFVDFTGLESPSTWTVSVNVTSRNASECQRLEVYKHHRISTNVNGSLPVHLHRAVLETDCCGCKGEDLVAEVTITEDTVEGSSSSLAFRLNPDAFSMAGGDILSDTTGRREY